MNATTPAAGDTASLIDLGHRYFLPVYRQRELVLERGAGVAAERLPNLVRSTRHLLGRAGRLELFALERAEGMLFVFPVGEGAIVVVTRPNVNIGAVLAARAALEEAA